MTAGLARNGFPDVSQHTVDRLMPDEGMNGLVRGRSAKTTVQAKNGGVRAAGVCCSAVRGSCGRWRTTICRRSAGLR